MFRKYAGDSQLRIEPANATASDPVGDVGLITVVDGSSLLTGDRFELRDFVNPSIKFVFDNETGTINQTVITRVITFDGTETDEEVRDLCLTAIANAPALDMIATAVGTNQIQIDQPTPGPSGKGTIVEVVADAGFIVDLSEPDGSHVMCLGSDLLLPSVEDYKIGDYVSVSQTINVSAPTKLITIQGRFRQPASLPIRETLPVGAEVEHVDRPVVANLGLLTTTAPFFNPTHMLRSVFLSGAGIVDGVYRILEVRNTMQAVLNGLPNPIASTSEAVTGYIQGAHWALNVILDGVTVFSLDPGYDGGKKRDWVLPDLSVNVSKFTGNAVLKYELRLVETSVT